MLRETRSPMVTDTADDGRTRIAGPNDSRELP